MSALTFYSSPHGLPACRTPPALPFLNIPLFLLDILPVPIYSSFLPQAAEYIATSDCPTYLAHAERRLGEEAERVGAYMDPSSEPKVIKVRPS
jgi:hypothetical protein